MNEPSEEVKAMARRIAARFYAASDDKDWQRFSKSVALGCEDEDEGVQCAIAAILETQEAVASWLEQYPSPMDDLNLALRIRGMCTAIRTGTHYGKAEQ